MKSLLKKEKLTAKEDDRLKDMRSVQEMYARGFEFVPIDLYRAKARHFMITDGKIMPPFASIPSLGEKAAESIEKAAAEGPFSSMEQLRERAGIGESTVLLLRKHGILERMPESEQMSLFDYMIQG